MKEEKLEGIKGETRKNPEENAKHKQCLQFPALSHVSRWPTSLLDEWLLFSSCYLQLSVTDLVTSSHIRHQFFILPILFPL
jgi:hypothetical protein